VFHVFLLNVITDLHNKRVGLGLTHKLERFRTAVHEVFKDETVTLFLRRVRIDLFAGVLQRRVTKDATIDFPNIYHHHFRTVRAGKD
jgi:hypothetical protein